MIENSKFKIFANEIITPFRLVIPQPLVEKIPLLMTNKDLRIVKTLEIVSGNALDIGCGENGFIRKYKKGGGKGIGVDVYDWGEQDLLVKDTSKLPFDDNSFDTVTFIASFNHIPNRDDVLIEVMRIIKNDGLLVISNLTPFISLIWHGISKIWDRDQIERGMIDGEVYGFKSNELIEMVEKKGFVFVKRLKFSWGLNSLFIFNKNV
jgi:SAM-dependent methyltransferase